MKFHSLWTALLAGLALTFLTATAAQANEGPYPDYSQEWQDARDNGAYLGAPESWGRIDPNGNNPAALYSFEPHFGSANNRLTDSQTGDQGYKWAVAGDKSYDVFHDDVYQLTQPDELTRDATPHDFYEQNASVSHDLIEACDLGNNAYWCGFEDTSPKRPNETYRDYLNRRPQGINMIHYSWSSGALDYRFNRYQGLHTSNRWVIYLQNSAGGLDWPRGQGLPGEPRMNFGSVATVGELRGFMRNEIQTGQGSPTYRYNLNRGLVYLNYIYGFENDEHPIEFLAVPENWVYMCARADEYGRPVAYEPYTFPDPESMDVFERGMSCPSDSETHWEYGYESEVRGDGSQTDLEITGPYAMWTEIEDQSPNGVGRVNFDTQRAYRLTPFGEAIERLCTARQDGCTDSTTFRPEEIAQLREAADAASDATGPRLDLTDENRTSLAEGRLVGVSQRSQDARITQHTSTDRYMRREIRTSTYYDDQGQVLETTRTVGEWEYANDPSMDIQRGESTFEVGSLRFVTGYQVLVTHCEGQDFDRVAGARSIDTREVTNENFTGTYLAASAVSNTYTDPTNAPWGRTGATSETRFYDRVCSYHGTRTDPDTEEPTNASVRSYSTAFRTNEPAELPTAYYTPTESGWVSYDGQGPTGFTATRWEGGTPIPGQFWLLGRDCQTGALTRNFFGQDDEAAPSLRQWVEEEVSTETVATGFGCYKDLLTRAVWASENREPQVLTVKWDFRPRVDTVTPTRDLGFTPSGQAAYATDIVAASVRGQVQSSQEPGRTSLPPRPNAWRESSGTGVENVLDVPVPFGDRVNSLGKWDERPDLFSPYYYGVTFVRGVAS